MLAHPRPYPWLFRYFPAAHSFSASVAAILTLALVNGAGALSEEDARKLAQDPHRIVLPAASFDTRQGPPPLAPDLTGKPAAGADYFIVQFSGPIGEREQLLVTEAGGEVFDYIPNHALLLRLSPAAEAALRARPDAVQWIGFYEPAYRLSPEIGTRTFADPARAADDHLWLTLDVFRGGDPQAVAAAATALGAQLVGMDSMPHVTRLRVRARPAILHGLARIRDVQWIEEWGEITLRNNTTRWVVQSNLDNVTPIWDRGIHGEGQIAGHIDGSINRASCYFMDPVNNTPGFGHRKLVAYRSSTGFGSDSHGTHTGGTIAGDQEPLNGTISGNGIAYRARISHSNLDDITGFLNMPSNLINYLTFAHEDGARVHTNSWGDDFNVGYTTWCRDIDVFSRNFEDALVGFAVTNMPTLRTPENAKNVLAIGATEQAPNQAQIGSGGAGPTSDGRRKPELFAPGIGIRSASTAACALANLSGTSMASPAVMGAAALVRQYYDEGWYPGGFSGAGPAIAATGALVKATLINTGVDMEPPSHPNFQEGWGRLLLDDALYFQGDERDLNIWDVRHADGLLTGDEARFDFQVMSSSEPLRVTLVFTDQPAAPGAVLTPVNDLNLQVAVPLVTKRRNAGGDSEFGTGGGTSDPLNNVEMLILAAPTPGVYSAFVSAFQVVGERQGFALVVTGDLEQQATAVPGFEVNLAPKAAIASVVPNPFHGGTEILLNGTLSTGVSLSVYDPSGRRISTLCGGVPGDGPIRLRWDGRDESGNPVASGVYLLKLEQGGQIAEVRKAVLVR